MKWDRKDQSIFDCVCAGLVGLKRSDWLTLDEYEYILTILQQTIDTKSKD